MKVLYRRSFDCVVHFRFRLILHYWGNNLTYPDTVPIAPICVIIQLGLLFPTSRTRAQHQEHQLGPLFLTSLAHTQDMCISWASFFLKAAPTRNIMSISWAFFLPPAENPAQLGLPLPTGRAHIQHHEHQLGLLFPTSHTRANIIVASSRSHTQHHEHQLSLLFPTGRTHT